MNEAKIEGVHRALRIDGVHVSTPRFQPLRGNVHVHVGVNDWGMSVINSHSRKQISAIELKNLEIKYTANTNYVEVDSRKRDFSATFTTPQVSE
jgi:hypothetical protein